MSVEPTLSCGSSNMLQGGTVKAVWIFNASNEEVGSNQLRMSWARCRIAPSNNPQLYRSLPGSRRT